MLGIRLCCGRLVSTRTAQALPAARALLAASAGCGLSRGRSRSCSGLGLQVRHRQGCGGWSAPAALRKPCLLLVLRWQLAQIVCSAVGGCSGLGHRSAGLMNRTTWLPTKHLRDFALQCRLTNPVFFVCAAHYPCRQEVWWRRVSLQTFLGQTEQLRSSNSAVAPAA